MEAEYFFKQKEKIVFLYAAPQSGHKSCADAVRRAIELNHPSFETIGMDAVTMLSPILGPIISRTYHEILKYTPQIWDFLYDNPEIEEMTRELRQIFHLLNASKLDYLLQEHRPSAFVCTHAIPCGVIAEQKKRGNCDLPLIAIVTDYAVHSYWIFPEVDLYIVANEECRKKLLVRDIPKEKIQVCGIPVDPHFSKKLSVAEARKKFGLEPNKPVILIMGGTHGFGPIKEIAKEILSLHPTPQLLIVTGMNKKLHAELKKEAKLKHAQIVGYTRQISFLMDAADLLITKPGGLTSAEALVKGLPMLLINHIPGQEERNAKYLVRNGAAVWVKDLRELKGVLRKLIHPRTELTHISERAIKISKPQSAQEAAEAIFSLLQRFKVRQSLLNFSQSSLEPEKILSPA